MSLTQMSHVTGVTHMCTHRTEPTSLFLIIKKSGYVLHFMCVLHCVAMCCSVLQPVDGLVDRCCIRSVCCVLQSMCVLHCVAMCCSVLQPVAVSVEIPDKVM